MPSNKSKFRVADLPFLDAASTVGFLSFAGLLAARDRDRISPFTVEQQLEIFAHGRKTFRSRRVLDSKHRGARPNPDSFARGSQDRRKKNVKLNRRADRWTSRCENEGPRQTDVSGYSFTLKAIVSSALPSKHSIRRKSVPYSVPMFHS
jgi:hypothetical protein